MELKTIPEDFKVREAIDLDTGGGSYSYFWLRKIGVTTLDAVKRIAAALRINPRFIGFAGFKDKMAVTEQAISIYNIGKEKVENLKFENIFLKYIGNGSRRINLGSLKGNDFEIVVRGLNRKTELKNREVLNLFDEQRFGVEKKNKEIGKALLKNNPKKVCELLGYEIKGNDYVNFLRTLPRRLLRLYVHSFQSCLWNEVVRNLHGRYEEVPLYGFLTRLQDGEIKRGYDNLLRKYGIKREDFLMKYFRELAVEGSSRKMFMKAENFRQEWFEDEGVNVRLKFFLGKGSYATMFVGELFAQGN